MPSRRHHRRAAPADSRVAIPRPELENVTLVEALGRLGRTVARAEDEVGATLADPTVAGALEVTIGAPLLEMARVMFDGAGEPVAFQGTLIPPQRHRLRIVVEATDDAQLRPVADLTLSAAHDQPSRRGRCRSD